MIRKIIIISSVSILIQLLLVSCVRQQKCHGKFLTASLEFGKLPSYDYSMLAYSSIKFDSLILTSGLSTEVYDCSNASNFGLVQSAYAWKPAPPIVAMQEKLDSINFITVRNYNANYPSGSRINNLIIHNFSASDWSTQSLSTGQVLENINNSISKPTTYFFDRFNSKFLEKPTLMKDTVQIAVTFYLSSGRKLEAVSKPMVVIQ